jgi:hypothetical protein
VGSNRKKKTTFAKLNREQKLRERRIDKAARKEARRHLSSGESGDAERRSTE